MSKPYHHPGPARAILLLTIHPGPGLPDLYVCNTQEPIESRGRKFMPFPFRVEFFGKGNVLIALERPPNIEVPMSGMTADVECLAAEWPNQPIAPPLRLEQKIKMPWDKLVAFGGWLDEMPPPRSVT